MDHLIAPSLLSADFLNLGKEIEMVNRSEADWFHLDIMDEVFVPNISFGFPLFEKIRLQASKPLDVHLIIIDPDRYVQRFRDAGADYISVHYETCPNLHRTVHAIKKAGAKAGVVLNPHSPVHLLTSIINDVDLVMLMAVNPGYGGQKLIGETFAKIGQLKDLIREKGSSALIEIDGGVDLSNASQLIHCGTDVLVAGNTVFSASDPFDVIRRLKHI